MKTNSQIIQCKDNQNPLSVSIKIGKADVKISERDFITMSQSFNMGGPVEHIQIGSGESLRNVFRCTAGFKTYDVGYYDSPRGGRDMYIRDVTINWLVCEVAPESFAIVINRIAVYFLEFFIEAA